MPTKTEPILTLWSLAESLPEHDRRLARSFWDDLSNEARRVLKQPGRKSSIRKYSDVWRDDEMENLLIDGLFGKFGHVEIPTLGTDGNVRIAWTRFLAAPWRDAFLSNQKKASPPMECIANAAGRGKKNGAKEASINAENRDALLAEVEQQTIDHHPSLEKIDRRRREQIKALEQALQAEMSAKAGDKRYQKQNTTTVALALLEISSKLMSSTELGEIPADLFFKENRKEGNKEGREEDNKEGKPNWSAITRWLESLGIKTSDKTVEKAVLVLSDALRRQDPVRNGGSNV